jgi:Purple acid Phosphatase, N-terminal domain
MLRAAGITSLLALCVAAAISGSTSDARASSQSPYSVTISSADAAAQSAVIGWKVSAAGRVIVEVGVDERYGVWSATTTMNEAGSGRTTLAGLEPNTTYRFRVVARLGTDPVSATGTFRTAPWPAAMSATLGGGSGGAAAAAAGSLGGTLFKQPAGPPGAKKTSTSAVGSPTSTTSGGPKTLTINGSPIFPRMVWRQCPYGYGQSLASGINLFLGVSCTTVAKQLNLLAGKAMSTLDHRIRDASGPGVIGWHLPDEVDQSEGDPELLPLSLSPGRLTFLTITDHFSPSTAPPNRGKGVYKPLFARSDVIGFDSYPVEVFCQNETLERVYRLQRDLIKAIGPKVPFQWIEAGPMEKCHHIDPTPAIVRGETWLAIAGGAVGIGYFPDIWPDAIRAEVAKLNREIVALAPALLAEQGGASGSSRSPVKVGARKYNGALYIIAANQSNKKTKALITAPGLNGRTLRVFADGRVVSPQGSQIYEDFDPYEARVYVAAPAGW